MNGKEKKHIADMSAAELLTEMRGLENMPRLKPVCLEDVYAERERADRHSEICHELERRCERHGIEYDPNIDRPYFYQTHGAMDRDKFRPGEKYTVIGNVGLSGRELRDLLTWVIEKGVNHV